MCNWIPVTEALPINSKPVVVSRDKGQTGADRIALGHYIARTDAWIGLPDDWRFWPPTHWMPLPALPPQEDTDDIPF